MSPPYAAGQAPRPADVPRNKGAQASSGRARAARPYAVASVFALLALAISACAAGVPARGTVAMREVSFPLRDFRLPSGLRVVVEEDRRAPVVAVVAVVGGGSSIDPPGKEGLSHLVDHLSFRARHAGSPSLWTRLGQLGAGHFGSYTTWDYTAYKTLVPREALPAMLRLEAQRLAAPLEGVTEEVFSVEREVLRNELRQYNETDYFGEVFQWIQETSFPAGHPYAQPVLGSRDSLFRITLADAQRFVRPYYQPENVTLVITGDVDLVAVEALLKESLPETWHGSGLPLAVSTRLPLSAPELPMAPKAAKLVTHVAAVSSPQLYLTWVLPRGFDEASAVHNIVRSSLFAEIYTAKDIDGDIEDIDTELVKGIRASLLVVRVQLHTGVHPEDSAEAVLDQMYRTWDSSGGAGDVLAHQHSFEQMQRWTYIGTLAKAEDVLARALNRAVLTHFTLDARSYGRTMAALMTLDGAKVTDFAYRWLHRDRARLLLVRPGVRDVPALASTVGIPPDDVAVAPPQELLSSAPTPLLPVTTLRLSNGLEVLLAPRPGMPLVSVGLALGGGAVSGVPGAAELARETAFRLSTFQGSMGDYGVYGSRQLTKDHLRYTFVGASGNVGNMLAMLSETVSSIGTHAEDLLSYRGNVLPLRKRADDAPEIQAYRALQRALYKGHPYGEAALATGEDLEKLTQSDVEDWLSETHRSANAVLVIAGEFEPQEVIPLVNRYLDQWGGKGRVELPPVPPPTKPGARPELIITPLPGATQGRVQMACRLPEATPEAAARYELMAEVLRARMWYQVRERMGATYGFYTLLSMMRGGALHLLMEDVVDAPQLGASMGSARAVLETYAREGIPEAEFESARRRLLTEHTMGLLTSWDWMNELLTARVLGWSPETVTRKPAMLQAVTSADLQKDFAGCLERLVVGIMGDEAQARTGAQAAFP